MSRNRALLIGLSLLVQASVPEPESLRTDHYRDAVPATLRGARVVHVAGLAALLPDRPVLIDVLPAPAPPPDNRPGHPRMQAPHRDIDGSHWLAETGRGTLPLVTESWFRARLAALTAGDKARTLVIYCLSQCWMSWNAAKRAVSYGYTSVVWFPDGADGWEAAGNRLVPATPELPPSQ